MRGVTTHRNILLFLLARYFPVHALPTHSGSGDTKGLCQRAWLKIVGSLAEAGPDSQVAKTLSVVTGKMPTALAPGPPSSPKSLLPFGPHFPLS